MIKLLALLLVFVTIPAFALEMPHELKGKTITLVSHSTAGGQNDIMARSIAKKVEDITGLNIIVLNKPGASGNIGAKFVQQSVPNGLTLCHCDIQPLIFNDITGVENSIKFGDLEAITIIRESPFAVIVPYNSKIININDLLQQSKKRELNFSSVGSLTTFWGVQLNSFAKSLNNLNIINYKGDPENAIAVAQELADFTIVGLSTALTFEASKKTRIIAVGSSKRISQLNQYPTITENHNMTMISFSGIFAPKNLPENIKEYLNFVFAEASKTKEFQEFLLQRGAVSLGYDLKSSISYYDSQYKLNLSIFKQYKELLK